MAAGRPTIISSEPLVSSDEVRHKGFATAFRGFDTNEVRTFLARVADELRAARDRHSELERLLAEAETRAAHPVLDESTLLGALGDETARIVHSARDAATDIKAKAEENVERLLREAGEEAARIKREADGLLATRTDEADAAAAQIREAAQVWGDEVRTKAREEADNIIEESKRHGREMVEEAQALRVKILGDLTRRRRVAMVQVEQLRAGRERLIEAYRMVRQTLDEVTDELARAEAEARVAAQVAGHKAGEETEPTPDELEVAASIAATLGADDATEAIIAADLAGPDGPAETAESGVSGEAAVAAVAAPADRDTDTGAEPGEGAARPTANEPVAVEVTVEATPAPEPPAAEAAPAPVSPSRPRAPKPSIDPSAHDERRLSSLRILRRPKPEPATASAVSGGSSHEPVTGEGVRIIRDAPSATVSVEEGEGADGGPSTDESGDATEVDALFARMRASRAEQVAEAEEVLAAGATDAAATDAEVGDSAGAGSAVEAVGTPADAAASTSDVAPEPGTESEADADGAPVPNADESALQQRDALIEPITHNLARKLKRALQDDQNDLLDRLRTNRGKVTDDLIGALDEHAGRFRLAAYDLLADAARAGTAFATGPADGAGDIALPAIADVADELAQGITGPLRTRLELALAEAVSENDDEQAVVERIGAAYREWKSQRIERVTSDHVVSSFSRGAYAATSEATSQRWVVDDVDGPCPDCDDNALAGPMARGQAFPTGQVHPPAHPGCRCVLVSSPA
ncbi:MAG: hypothetical protein QOG03_204 [Actinomycetota bacterium]|jgi:DivIVA domain-containing protein|nr:hypothetical protein [Actinomycetota bacterium]